MPWNIPDNAGLTGPPDPNQARWFQVETQIIAAALAGTGVASGCAVTAQIAPDMTVAIAAGTILAAGVSVAVTGGNLTVGAAHATLLRLDLITASAAGVKTITAGTAASSPKPPLLPTGHIALAIVFVNAVVTTVTSQP
jgi:hypothetical protein